MKSMHAVGLVGLGLSVLVGCGGSGGGGSTGDDQNQTGANKPPAAGGTGATGMSPGEYVLDNASVGATLTILSADTTKVSYSLGILGKTGSHHNGELEQRSAAGSGSTFNDTVDDECKISLQSVASDSIQVKQTGACSNDFGAFLDASGTYKKKAGSTSSGFVGLYENETTHRAWGIRVTSESPFAFRLVAGHLENSSERVDTKGQGTASGDSILFENGPDCSLKFSKTATGIHVTQSGTCKKIGFPDNDDLSISDDSGADFGKLDESSACFDTKELAVGATKQACKSPL